MVYDASGRVVAQATFSGNGLPAVPAASDWICTTYDARGRPTQVKYPAFGGAPARTVDHNYTWNGFPSATLTNDGSSVGSMVDLLGRPWYELGVYGDQTQAVYDQAARRTEHRTAITEGERWLRDKRFAAWVELLALTGAAVSLHRADVISDATDTAAPAGASVAKTTDEVMSLLERAREAVSTAEILADDTALVQAEVRRHRGRRV